MSEVDRQTKKLQVLYYEPSWAGNVGKYKPKSKVPLEIDFLSVIMVFPNFLGLFTNPKCDTFQAFVMKEWRSKCAEVIEEYEKTVIALDGENTFTLRKPVRIPKAKAKKNKRQKKS